MSSHRYRLLLSCVVALQGASELAHQLRAKVVELPDMMCCCCSRSRSIHVTLNIVCTNCLQGLLNDAVNMRMRRRDQFVITIAVQSVYMTKILLATSTQDQWVCAL